MGRGIVYTVSFSAWLHDVTVLLDRVDCLNALGGRRKILIKPNLVEALPPPVTTPVGLVAAVVDYLRARVPDAEIIVAEGSGSLDYETAHVFDVLGYSSMAREKQVALVDLNHEPLVQLERASCRRLPSIYLPRILFDAFLLSVPVLKAHTLAGVTLTMKNMMGAVPPKHYQSGGHWKKASLHRDIHAAVFDLNQYRAPDLTVLDATVGMQHAHLWGPTCNPHPQIIACSVDPVAIDAYGADLLSRDWQNIGHIAMADGVLGTAAPSEVVHLPTAASC